MLIGTPYSSLAILRTLLQKYEKVKTLTLSPDVADLCGVPPQTLKHILQMAAAKHQKTMADLGGGNILPANTDRGACAAQHVGHQFHHAFHVLPPKLPAEGLVLDVFLHFSALFVSIYPSAGR